MDEAKSDKPEDLSAQSEKPLSEQPTLPGAKLRKSSFVSGSIFVLAGLLMITVSMAVDLERTPGFFFPLFSLFGVPSGVVMTVVEFLLWIKAGIGSGLMGAGAIGLFGLFIMELLMPHRGVLFLTLVGGPAAVFMTVLGLWLWIAARRKQQN